MPTRLNSRPRSPQSPVPHAQHGGTFVGVVIGLVIGLAIAIGIALYITRAQTPFAFRSDSQASAPTAQSASDADPNAALFARKPAASAADANPQSSPTSSSADPIGDIARNAARDDGSYLLQTGAFKSSDEAQQQKAKLTLAGFDAQISPRDVGDTRFYRVRIGPFAKADEMSKARDRLSALGIDATVIRSSR